MKEEEVDLIRLCLVLSTTICYGIRNDPPKLDALLATTINESNTLNIVIASTEEPDGFKRVLPAKWGGVPSFLMGRVLFLSGQGKLKCFIKWTKALGTPFLSWMELDHFQVLLEDAHWGYWKRTRPN